MAKTIKVRAGDGRSLPLPRGIAIDSGLTVITPETPVEVVYNRYIRRRIAMGDLVEVEGAGAAKRRGRPNLPGVLPLPPADEDKE